MTGNTGNRGTLPRMILHRCALEQRISLAASRNVRRLLSLKDGILVWPTACDRIARISIHWPP